MLPFPMKTLDLKIKPPYLGISALGDDYIIWQFTNISIVIIILLIQIGLYAIKNLGKSFKISLCYKIFFLFLYQFPVQPDPLLVRASKYIRGNAKGQFHRKI